MIPAKKFLFIALLILIAFSACSNSKYKSKKRRKPSSSCGCFRYVPQQIENSKQFVLSKSYFVDGYS
jgi:hypothetical protein